MQVAQQRPQIGRLSLCRLDGEASAHLQQVGVDLGTRELLGSRLGAGPSHPLGEEAPGEVVVSPDGGCAQATVVDEVVAIAREQLITRRRFSCRFRLQEHSTPAGSRTGGVNDASVGTRRWPAARR